MSYQTSSKRSPPFCLLIGARKLVFFWHQSEDRTASTVWNWSGKTLSPGALLTVLYFSLSHIFLPVQTLPRPLYVPLGLRGWYFSFCHRRYKIFMLFFQQRNVSSVFYLSLQISITLYLIELCWPAAYFLFFSVFLWPYNNIYYSKFVDMTIIVIDLSLMLQTRRIQKQFLLSIFRLY